MWAVYIAHPLEARKRVLFPRFPVLSRLWHPTASQSSRDPQHLFEWLVMVRTLHGTATAYALR
jgi:hypothetical protein